MILGPLEVRVEGERVSLGGPRQRALLALLLLHANEVVSRDRLIEALWADAKADHTLRVSVSRLRKALAVGGSSPLETVAPGYRLRVASGELDRDRFERLAAAGRDAGDPETLRAAEALWRGPPLAELGDAPFARAEIERLEEMRIATVEERVDAELALGRHAALVAELAVLIASHPLRERLRGQLMLALYRCGRQADALAVYREGRERLVDELGLEPSPALARLELAILRHDPALEPVVREQTVAPPVRTRRVPRLAVAAVLAACLGAVALAGRGPEAQAPTIGGNALALVSAPGTHRATALGAPPTRAVAGFGSLWVTHVDAASVSRVDLRTQAVRQVVRVGSGPTGVAVAGGAVWVANTRDGTVSRIDPGSDTVVQTIPIGAQAGALAAAGDTLWVAARGDGQVSRIDARAGRVVARLRIGAGPSALVVRGHDLWVAAQDDGAIARVDTRTNMIVQQVRVGDSPSALAATADDVWVADRLDATLSRVDAATGAVVTTLALPGAPEDVAVWHGGTWATAGEKLVHIERDRIAGSVRVGDRAGPLALAGDELWAGLVAGGARHRGGTLTVALANQDVAMLDPADGGGGMFGALGLVYDGLVALDHVPGPDGSRLVPDLALALPLRSADGRRYLFRMRPGIRYASGATVRASDVRRSLERMFFLGGVGADLLHAIEGAADCTTGARCDLSSGVVSDDRAGTVTFRLRRPDPEFVYKLTLPAAYVLPASAPPERSPTIPGTGPYHARITPERVTYERNPYFHEWSSAAQPAGYPDRIVWPRNLSADVAARMSERETADLLLSLGPVPPAYHQLVRTRFPSRLHVNPTPGTEFFFLNTRAKPFDDVRVRRALNFAIDRRRVVALFDGADYARETCQVLPPQMPGYHPFCPYRHDLARARALVAASSTRGATITIGVSPDPPFVAIEGRYVASVLRRLGYRVRLENTTDPGHAQVITGGWTADYPTAGSFISKLRCGLEHSNLSGFCAAHLDRRIARAETLQQTNPAAAERRWASLDRAFTDRAIWLPTISYVGIEVTSTRVSNYHNTAFLGTLIDQLWIR